MTIELSEDKVLAVLQIIGGLPTSSNAWPLLQEIGKQYEAQKEPEDE